MLCYLQGTPLKNTSCILLSACMNLELNPFLNRSHGTGNLSLGSCSVAQLLCDCRWVWNLSVCLTSVTWGRDIWLCSSAVQRRWRNWRATGAVRSNLKNFSRVVSRSFSWDSSEGHFHSASTVMYWWRLICISAQTNKQRNLLGFNSPPYFFYWNKQIRKMLYFSNSFFFLIKFFLFMPRKTVSYILKRVISKQNVDNFWEFSEGKFFFASVHQVW